jgi:hypothetical protein
VGQGDRSSQKERAGKTRNNIDKPGAWQSGSLFLSWWISRSARMPAFGTGVAGHEAMTESTAAGA